jgi:AcrR family transcriptional regulator
VRKDPEVRKAEIFEAALRLFNEKGYDATAISDIVKDVGVSQGAFYWYFTSKEDILEEAADVLAARMYEEFEAIVDNEHLGAGDKLDRFFEAMEKAALEGGQLVEEIHAPGHKHYHDKIARSIGASLLALVNRLIAEGIDEGVFDVPDPEAASLFILLPGMFSHGDEDLPMLSEMSVERWIEAYHEMAYRILGFKRGAGREHRQGARK